MIILTKGNTANEMYVTPLELASSTPAWYYFKFTNRVTNDVIEYWGTDESTDARYQKFIIDVDDYFDTFDMGFWKYEIYGVDDENEQPTSSVLETGFMYLKPENEFTPTKYNEQSTNFTTYHGQ